MSHAETFKFDPSFRDLLQKWGIVNNYVFRDLMQFLSCTNDVSEERIASIIRVKESAS
jgi:hypothetical protein